MAVNGKVFFDTNILVYQFDLSAPTKRKRAIELIEKNILDERAAISSQVVQEFMNVALGKFQTQISARELELVMEDLLTPLCQHLPNPEFYMRVLRLYQDISVSFYDALIIQSALDLDCVTLYSEDLQDGLKLGTLTIKNPFTG